MTRVTLDRLASDLSALDPRELVYVLSRSLPGYVPHEGEPEISESRFFLGVWSVVDGDQSVDIVAYPDEAEYGDVIGPDWGFCQAVNSSLPDISFVSNFKRGLSPLDGGKISMT